MVRGVLRPNPFAIRDDCLLPFPCTHTSKAPELSMDSVYRLEGSRVLTGPMAGGPWDPKLQHGSAPSALIIAVAEAVPTAAPMRVARLTVDLMRPIPVAPLEIKTEILREGRKIQLC